MDQSRETVHPAGWILRWSSANALGLVAAAFAGWRVNSAWPVLAAGSLSLLFFLLLAQKRLAGAALWNSANIVTLFRWVGISGLALAAPQARGYLMPGGGLVLIGLDSLDGWLARRQGTQTDFSEFLDKEIDSLFLLVVTLSLVSRGLEGAWVLTIGLSRYLFVISLLVLRPRRRKERRSPRGRLVYSAVLLTLLALHSPLGLPQTWPAVGCLAVLLASFFLDVKDVFFGEVDG
jgi:phosphatidylglycerophosphate synthase